MKKMIIGFLMAWGNFSSLPCPIKKWEEDSKKWMISLMQLVGLFIGVIQLCLFMIGDFLTTKGVIGEAYTLKAAFFMAIPFILTGFIHLDGYMDCSDAIFSRRELDRRREILKDSSVGAFAVSFAIIAFTFYFAAMKEILESDNSYGGMFSIIVVLLISRGLASLDVLTIKPLEVSQYASEKWTEKNWKYILICGGISIAGIGIGLSLISKVFDGNPNILIVGVICAVIGQKISSKIAVADLQGMNGDIAGFSIVSGEVLGVVGIALMC